MWPMGNTDLLTELDIMRHVGKQSLALRDLVGL